MSYFRHVRFAERRSTAAAKSGPVATAMSAHEYPPVLFLIHPTRTGPKKPARLPTELMRAIPAGAAASDRNAKGTLQKTGKAARMPIAAAESANRTVAGASNKADAPRPSAATAQAATACKA
jgi:hypothetical protein